jgi:proteasome lid subunit RPN8/RPN11
VRVVEQPLGDLEEFLSENQVRVLLYYAAMDPDREVCGVILKGGQIEQLKNTHENPAVAFDMQIDLGAEIEYVWHSHPRGRPDPSKDDLPHMELLHKYGHDYGWLIIAGGVVRLYRMVE